VYSTKYQQMQNNIIMAYTFFIQTISLSLLSLLGKGTEEIMKCPWVAYLLKNEML
jgi:hypothetical protein